MAVNDASSSQQTSTLSQEELKRLEQALESLWAVPFVDDINGPLWETVFRYTKGLPIPDRLTPIVKTLKSGKKSVSSQYKGTKLLFDAVDPKSKVGWSLKIIEWSPLAPGTNVDFVIQRAHISSESKGTKKIRKGGESSEQLFIPEILMETEVVDDEKPVLIETVTLASSEEDLGRALIECWNNKVLKDMETQNVETRRLGILIKSTNRKVYIFVEKDMQVFDPDKLKWSWTNEKKAGLQAKDVSTGHVVLRWYHSQKQLFQSLPIPQNASRVHIEPKRLQLDTFINSTKTLINQQAKELRSIGRLAFDD